MLILQRREGEKVLIGDDISISVVSVDGNRVRLAISAPREVPIKRGEVRDAEFANQESAAGLSGSVELLELLGAQGVLNVSREDISALQEHTQKDCQDRQK